MISLCWISLHTFIIKLIAILFGNFLSYGWIFEAEFYVKCFHFYQQFIAGTTADLSWRTTRCQHRMSSCLRQRKSAQISQISLHGIIGVNCCPSFIPILTVGQELKRRCYYKVRVYLCPASFSHWLCIFVYFCLRIGKKQLKISKIRWRIEVNDSSDMNFIRFRLLNYRKNQYDRYTLNW